MNKLKKLLLISLIFTTISGAFFFTVYADTDKSNLIEAYNNIQSIYSTQDASPVDNPYYQDTSYQAFIDSINSFGGLNGIQSVIDDPLAEQVDVDNLTSSINSAIAGLILNDTYFSILSDYLQAKAIDISNFTPNSQILYNTELERIKSIIDNPVAGEIVISGLHADITKSYNLLVLQADRNQLEILNNLIIKTYYEDANLYTTSSYEAFKTAVDSYGSYLFVNSIINDDNVLQTTVDSLESTLQDALDLLVPLENNTNLLSIYYELKVADISGYTMNSQIAYNLELNRLYALIMSDNLDATIANQVLIDFTNIKKLLISLPDYSQLQITYDSTLIYREEDYSISSYTELIRARLKGLYVLSNPNATQKEVDDTIILLNNSVKQLKQKIGLIYIVQGDSLDINQYITLGEAKVLSYSVDNNQILSIDSNGLVKGLEYGKSKVSISISNGATETIDIFVKAKLSTTVYILVFLVPVIGIGLAFSVIFVKKDSLINIFRKIFSKKI